MSSDARKARPAPQPPAAEAPRTASPDSRIVVGIGASAGGLEAFQRFFQRMPADSGMAFVLVQHLDPRHETLMPELLSKQTSMPVAQAIDGTAVEPNHVYFIPPNATLTLQASRLRVAIPAESHGFRTPIDHFLKSLGRDQGESSVAVILSGTGSDGTLGIRSVKEMGGMTVVQSPESAKYDSMPRNAISTGMVDYVLPVEDIPDLLVKYTRHREELKIGKVGSQLENEAAGILPAVCDLIRAKFHRDFRQYKHSTLLRRIQRRMQLQRADNGSEYLEILAQTPDEAEHLFKDFLIGVTYFFRDPEVWTEVGAKVIPHLLETAAASQEGIRIWVPGCASGEEAFTIAVLLREALDGKPLSPKIQIFGTDIDAAAIAAARRAVFSEGMHDHVSAERVSRFFHKLGDGYQVSKEIRDMCLFSVHDLIRDPPFSRLDFLSCRNVLIYMEQELQEKVFPLFHYALKPEGNLLLGPTENLPHGSNLFALVDKKSRIFVSKAVLTRPPLRFPLVESTKPRPAAIKEPAPRAPREKEFTDFVGREILAHYAPPHVVVNEHFDVVYFSDRLEGYLTPAHGVPNNNLIQMARKSMRLDLRTLLSKVAREKKKCAQDGVVLHDAGSSGAPGFVRITAAPFRSAAYLGDLFLVLFEEGRDHGQGVTAAERSLSESEIVQTLENDLKDTRLQLQSTIEELERANEELKSSNEELLSMNEELQSTNEELQSSQEEMQSVNEELETVNVELSSKVDELDVANGDLNNLLKSTQIATLFLDSALKLKRFTPEAMDLFHILNADIGRPITDFATRFKGIALGHEIEAVIRNLSVKEALLQLEDGSRWFKVRIHPYKTVKSVIAGAVVTFYELTEQVRAEERLKRHLEQQVSVAELGMQAIKGTYSMDRLREAAVSLVARGLQLEHCAILDLREGQRWLVRAAAGWERESDSLARITADLAAHAAFTLQSGSVVSVPQISSEQRFGIPMLREAFGGGSAVSVVIPGKERPYGVIACYTRARRDFLDRDARFLQSIANILSSALERGEADGYRTRLAAIIEQTPDAVISKRLDGVVMSWNQGAERMFGISAEEAIGYNVDDRYVPEELRGEVAQEYENAAKGIDTAMFETHRRGPSGSILPVAASMSTLRDGDVPVGVSLIFRDISERKRYEEALLRAKDEATSRDETKTRFLGTLSHELRTPLAAVSGFTDLALREKTLSDDVRGYLQRVRRNAGTMGRLIEDLLDVSRIERGSLPVQKKWFETKSILDTIISTLGAEARAKRLEFGVDWDPSVPEKIFSDPVRLRQIVWNLVSNAVKYTSKGSVAIHCRAFGARRDPSIVVTVTDTGIGITAEKQQAVFDPFFRANPNVGPAGVGLGLFLSRQIAGLLGGTLRLERSAPNEGSIFSVRIPVEVQDVTAIADEGVRARATADALRGLKILLAEDTDDLRKLVSTMLVAAGAEVTGVANGREAVERLDGERYDLVLLDLIMPEMGGIEVLRAAQERLQGPLPPFIAITAHAMRDDVAACKAAGFLDVILKPVTAESLVGKLLVHARGAAPAPG